jgi:hypothetical protein
MKGKILKSKEKDNWALPGNPISLDDFKDGIKKAEKELFYTIGESRKVLEEWRKKRNSR